MTKVSSLNHDQVIRVLRLDGWVVVRQRGGHVRLHKPTADETLKIVIPAHRPIERSTPSRILKRARLDLDQFLQLL